MLESPCNGIEPGLRMGLCDFLLPLKPHPTAFPKPIRQLGAWEAEGGPRSGSLWLVGWETF